MSMFESQPTLPRRHRAVRNFGAGHDLFGPRRCRLQLRLHPTPHRLRGRHRRPLPDRRGRGGLLLNQLRSRCAGSDPGYSEHGGPRARARARARVPPLAPIFIATRLALQD